MANTFIKLPLSASVDGKSILLTTTASSVAIPIHTTPTGITSTDEVWLYAYNDSLVSLQTSILWGSTTEPDDVTRTQIGARSGRVLITDGRLLRNGLTISAYASNTSSVTIDGFVNRITLS